MLPSNFFKPKYSCNYLTLHTLADPGGGGTEAMPPKRQTREATLSFAPFPKKTNAGSRVSEFFEDKLTKFGGIVL